MFPTRLTLPAVLLAAFTLIGCGVGDEQVGSGDTVVSSPATDANGCIAPIDGASFTLSWCASQYGKTGATSLIFTEQNFVGQPRAVKGRIEFVATGVGDSANHSPDWFLWMQGYAPDGTATLSAAYSTGQPEFIYLTYQYNLNTPEYKDTSAEGTFDFTTGAIYNFVLEWDGLSMRLRVYYGASIVFERTVVMEKSIEQVQWLKLGRHAHAFGVWGTSLSISDARVTIY